MAEWNKARLNPNLMIGRGPGPKKASTPVGSGNPGQDLVNLFRKGGIKIRGSK